MAETHHWGADRDNLVRLVSLASSNAVSSSECAAALDTIAAIRAFLDRLEKQIAAARIVAHDDRGAA
jgi:hypothetical protein